ncbi:hypothetical protein CPB83DRAFT_232707 [Crepidotus variabilis]|uniref:Uncharacterized protein n=1 Tax=Crepidotus variabilis TaxID=179855 RepID=A0A9P6JV83_9AGAR|nr:hypothetical protein CPB83DRAFT_232707 [Crepidotus variabilis]
MARLKPLLLMQSYPTSRVTQTSSTPAHLGKATEKGKRKESSFVLGRAHLRRQDLDSSYSASSSKLASCSRPLPNSPPLTSGSQSVSFEGSTAVVTQRRKGKDSTGKTKKSKHQRATPIFSDAYSEHILLASQKIGRKRSTIVTGMQRIAERERESLAQEQALLESKLEQDNLGREHRSRATAGVMTSAYYRPVGESASPQRTGISRPMSSVNAPPPHTPQRNPYPIYHGVTNNPNPGGVNTPSPSTYVFVNTSATPPSNTALPYSGDALNTSGHLTAPLNTSPSIRPPQSTGPNNPPTPLDSLVDAARMMGENNGHAKVNGRRRPLDEPDSPSSKRRKVATEKNRLPNHQGPKIDRVKSALDVLADQAAAAVNEPGQSSRASSSLVTSAYSGPPSETKGRSRVNSKEPRPLDNDKPAKSPKSRTSSRTIKPSAKKRGISIETASASASTSTSIRTTTRSSGRKQPVVASSGSRVIARPSALPTSEADDLTYAGLRPIIDWGDRPVAQKDDQEEDSYHSDSPKLPHAVPQNPPRDISAQSYGPPVQNFALTYRAYSHEFDQAARRPITPLRTSEPPDQLYSPEEPDEEHDVEPQAHQPTGKSPATEIAVPTSEVLPSNTEPITRTIEHSPSHTPPSNLIVNSMPNPKTQLTSSSSHSKQSHSKLSTEVEHDEDAEGEEEEEEGDADADYVRDHPRTRSPPPPDPPPPGFDDGAGSGDEHDADPDADAEGDMDTDQSEEPSSRMTDSANGQSRTLRFTERNPTSALTEADCRPALLKFPKDMSCRPHRPLDFGAKLAEISDCSNLSENPLLACRLSKPPIPQCAASNDCGASAEGDQRCRSGSEILSTNLTSGKRLIYDDFSDKSAYIELLICFRPDI